MTPPDTFPWWQFWRTGAPLGRRSYLFWGVALMSVKYNLDRLVAASYGHAWSGIRYLVPNEVFTLGSLPRSLWPFYGMMVLVALPFIAVGVLLTRRRLRDASLSPWLTMLFFAPAANLLFFAVLCVLPTVPPRIGEVIADARHVLEEPRHDAPQGKAFERDVAPPEMGRLAWLARAYPENPTGSALTAILLADAVCGGFVTMALKCFPSYGWGLFLGVPFSLGFLSALLHGLREHRTTNQCVGVALGALVVAYAALIVLAMEGAICLLMSLPLVIPLVLLGAWMGYEVQHNAKFEAATRFYAGAPLLLLLPLLLRFDHFFEVSPELLPVKTQVVIDAPPQRVFPNVVTFSELPPATWQPRDWLFHTGIAYPLRARIDGQGPGAIRYCEFSTGPFVEPITAWDAPHRLAFGVVAQPPPLRELSPYGAIHPPHLDNFLVSRRGQFLLTALPGNRTLLEGTTWYQNRMWPQSYWRGWSDFIIHRIHTRVLDHVKRLSETPG